MVMTREEIAKVVFDRLTGADVQEAIDYWKGDWSNGRGHPCGVRHENGAYCCRPSGHLGDHIATADFVLARWPQEAKDD